MFPSWNSLEELQLFHDRLQTSGIIAGLAAALIVAVYTVTQIRIGNRIDSLKEAAAKEEATARAKAESPEAHSSPSKSAAGSAAHRHVTPAYIEKTIGDAPPLARDNVRTQFSGVPISWDLSLRSSFKSGGTTYLIMDSDRSGPHVVSAVDVEKHPFLLQAPKGTKLHVEGTIDTAEDSKIDLKDAIITLAPQ